MFEWVGTAYDIMVHILMVYALWPYVVSQPYTIDSIILLKPKTTF